MVGYNGMAKTAAQQAPAAISVIKFTYLYVPIIVWVVMMLITMCYKLDKTYKTDDGRIVCKRIIRKIIKQMKDSYFGKAKGEGYVR